MHASTSACFGTWVYCHSLELCNINSTCCCASAAWSHMADGCYADSEHSAIFQCIQGLPEGGLRRIILTASGGAFRDWPVEKLKTVKVADALKHPNWSMGRKITVDSATLMNKGLEVIEAHYLFGVGYDNIDIVIHPQSIIHSMVETQDSSVLAQVSQICRSNRTSFWKLQCLKKYLSTSHSCIILSIF